MSRLSLDASSPTYIVKRSRAICIDDRDAQPFCMMHILVLVVLLAAGGAEHMPPKAKKRARTPASGDPSVFRQLTECGNKTHLVATVDALAKGGWLHPELV